MQIRNLRFKLSAYTVSQVWWDKKSDWIGGNHCQALGVSYQIRIKVQLFHSVEGTTVKIEVCFK